MDNQHLGVLPPIEDVDDYLEEIYNDQSLRDIPAATFVPDHTHPRVKDRQRDQSEPKRQLLGFSPDLFAGTTNHNNEGVVNQPSPQRPAQSPEFDEAAALRLLTALVYSSTPQAPHSPAVEAPTANALQSPIANPDARITHSHYINQRDVTQAPNPLVATAAMTNDHLHLPPLGAFANDFNYAPPSTGIGHPSGNWQSISQVSNQVAPPIAPPSVPLQAQPLDLFATEAQADAHLSHRGQQVEFARLRIKSGHDDLDQVSDEQKRRYKQDIVNALLHQDPNAPTPAGVDYEKYAKQQREGLAQCRERLGRCQGDLHAQACAAKLFFIVERLHRDGIDKYMLKGTSGTASASRYGIDWKSTFTQRMADVITAIKGNQRVAVDVLDLQGLDELAQSPKPYVARKLTNIKGNNRRPASTSASTGTTQSSTPAANSSTPASTSSPTGIPTPTGISTPAGTSTPASTSMPAGTSATAGNIIQQATTALQALRSALHQPKMSATDPELTNTKPTTIDVQSGDVTKEQNTAVSSAAEESREAAAPALSTQGTPSIGDGSSEVSAPSFPTSTRHKRADSDEGMLNMGDSPPARRRKALPRKSTDGCLDPALREI